MDPFLGKVVAVENADRQPPPADELREGELRLVLELTGRLVLQADRTDDVDQPLPLAVAELVRVLVFPAHGRLQHVVQPGEGEVRRHRHPAPDLRGDLVEEDLDDEALGHAPRLAAC